jgi:hypothetical protein
MFKKLIEYLRGYPLRLRNTISEDFRLIKRFLRFLLQNFDVRKLFMDITKQLSRNYYFLPNLKELGIGYCALALTLFTLNGLLCFGAWDRLTTMRGSLDDKAYAQLSYELSVKSFSFQTSDISLPCLAIGLFYVYMYNYHDPNKAKPLKIFYVITQILIILNLVLFFITATLFVPLLIFPDEFPLSLKRTLDIVFKLLFKPKGDYLWDTLRCFVYLSNCAKLSGAILVIFAAVSSTKLLPLKTNAGVWLIILSCILEIISLLFK